MSLRLAQYFFSQATDIVVINGKNEKNHLKQRNSSKIVLFYI